MGDGLDPATDMGPLINARAVTRADALVRDAETRGARLLAGGHRHALGGTRTTPDHRPEAGHADFSGLKSSDPWPPSCPLTRKRKPWPWPTIPATAWPLTSAPITCPASGGCSGPAIRHGRRQRHHPGRGGTPFGGTKNSGLGREGGREGLLEYMETRYLLLGGLEG